MSDIRKLIDIVEAAQQPRKIGKRIGGELYVHKNYAIEAGVPADQLKFALSKIPADFDYTVIKYNPKSGMFSFIESPDFDTADEPISGTSLRVAPDGTVKTTKQAVDPWIYHHKWQWVPDDYTGFDVEQSKQRSRQWQDLPDVDKSRIGKKSYWDTNVIPRIK